MTTCLHCHATTSNGLALCELCRRKVLADLEFLSIYFRNLARWSRPNRPNGSLGARGSWLLRRGETNGSLIDAALNEAGNALTTWARTLIDARPQVLANQPLEAIFSDLSTLTEVEQVRYLCAGFERWLTSIATLDWCGEFVREISEQEEALRKMTETAVPGWYAGACKFCHAPTYVVPGLTWLTCRACGSTSAARDHAETIITEARDWIATPASLAGAVVALVDTEQSVQRLRKRIAKWGDREQVTAHRRLDRDGDPIGPKRYRFGEVLDTLRIEGATSLADDECAIVANEAYSARPEPRATRPGHLSSEAAS